MTNPTRPLSYVLLIAFALLSFASTAYADETDTGPSAYELRDQATKQARKRRYKEAIGLYKEAIAKLPNGLPNAYYNLAEILKVRKDWAFSSIFYTRFLELQPDVSDRKQIEAQIRTNQAQIVLPGTLKLTITHDAPEVPAENLTVFINGFVVSTSKEPSLKLPAGKYDLKVRATDFQTFTGRLEVPAKDTREAIVHLKKQTFFGTLKLNVNVEGANVSIAQSPAGTSPLKEPLKLAAGKHFIEVTKDGYHRWIRNVIVNRDEDVVVDIKLQKQK